MFISKNLFWVVLLFSASPAWAGFGNWFTANQRLSTPLDSSDKKISFRFTCQDDMNLSAAAVYCTGAVKSPAYRVSLQEDKGGFPSGEEIASASYVPLAHSWTTAPLSSAPLFKGKIYHLVLEQDSMRGGAHKVGVIGPANFASFLSTDVPNHMHPNDGSPDPSANVLVFDKGRWNVLDQEPVYVLYGTGNQFQGNPYDDPGVRPIYGSDGDKSHQSLQGEALHFHCGFQATHLVIRVRKQGNPQSPLNYVVLRNEYQIHQSFPVHTAVALKPAQASSNFQWVTIGLDDPTTSNFSPECWYLVLQTDSGRSTPKTPGCEDCYLLSDVGNSGGLSGASQMTFDGGAHLSREVYSTDGGSPSNWLDEFERDANLCALGPDCHYGSSSGDRQLIPPPEPLDGDKEFQP